MKKVLEKLEISIGKTAYQMTKTNVNSACCYMMHQSKLPECAKKLHK